MEESEDNMSSEDIVKVESPLFVKAKPKKRSLIERELETSLTAHITSPVINNVGNTSRYGRSRRVKQEADYIDVERGIQLMHSPVRDKTPVKIQSPVYKMHASNSPIKIEHKETPIKAPILADGLENQIENIYHENISLSRFGSDEKKNKSPANKFPKVYVRKDLIQKREKEETVMLIKNMFSPSKSGQKSNNHLNNILERSSEKYSLNTSNENTKSHNGFLSNSSVVKTLDFDNKNKKKENRDIKFPSKSDIFDMEAKCEYQVGDLAWARMGTYPFWPCIVTREPSSGMFVKKKLFGRIERDVIHVTFFGDNGRRGWIVDTMLRKFLGQLEFEATKQAFSPMAKKKDPRLYAAFFVSEKKMPQWSISVEEAETLLREPKRLRIDLLYEMLANYRTVKCSLKQQQRSEKKMARTASDVSLSESLFDTLFSEDDGKTEDAERTKTRKSLDVSEVVTACLDNMAAKTGITKIQRQSHMDRWLQKAKSKTPEKTQANLANLPPPKEKEVPSAKKKKKISPIRVPIQKPYSFRKSSYEPQILKPNDNEHDYSTKVNNNLPKTSDESGISLDVIPKEEPLNSASSDVAIDADQKVQDIDAVVPEVLKKEADIDTIVPESLKKEADIDAPQNSAKNAIEIGLLDTTDEKEIQENICSVEENEELLLGLDKTAEILPSTEEQSDSIEQNTGTLDTDKSIEVTEETSKETTDTEKQKETTASPNIDTHKATESDDAGKKSADFLKYMELRQDAIMDEHPDLSHDEIVDYLYKTWLYEDHSVLDKSSDDSKSNVKSGKKKTNRKSLSLNSSFKKSSRSRNEQNTSTNSTKTSLRMRLSYSPSSSKAEKDLNMSQEISIKTVNVMENQPSTSYSMDVEMPPFKEKLINPFAVGVSKKSNRSRLSNVPGPSKADILEVSQAMDVDETQTETHSKDTEKSTEVLPKEEKPSTSAISSDTNVRKSLRISSKDVKVCRYSNTAKTVENTPAKFTESAKNEECIPSTSRSSGTSSRKILKSRTSNTPSTSKSKKELEVSNEASTSVNAVTTPQDAMDVLQNELDLSINAFLNDTSDLDTFKAEDDIDVKTESQTIENTQMPTQHSKDTNKSIEIPAIDEKLAAKSIASGTTLRKSRRTKLSHSPSSRGQKELDASKEGANVAAVTPGTSHDAIQHGKTAAATKIDDIKENEIQVATKPLSTAISSRKSLRTKPSNSPSTSKADKELDSKEDNNTTLKVTETTSENTHDKGTDKSGIKILENEEMLAAAIPSTSGTSTRKSLRTKLPNTPSNSRVENELESSKEATTSKVTQNIPEMSQHVTESSKDIDKYIDVLKNDEKLSTKSSNDSSKEASTSKVTENTSNTLQDVTELNKKPDDGIEIPENDEKTSTKSLSIATTSRKSLRIRLSNAPSNSRGDNDPDSSKEVKVTEKTPETTHQVTESEKNSDECIEIPKNDDKPSTKVFSSDTIPRKSLRTRVSNSPSTSRVEKELDSSQKPSTSKDTENPPDSSHHVTECIEIPKTAEKTSTKPLSSDTISRKSLRISLSNPPSTSRDEKDLDVSMEGSSIEDVTVVTENTQEATQQVTEPGKETDKSMDIPENEKLYTKSLSSGTTSRKSLRIRISKPPSISRDEKLDVSMGASTSKDTENTKDSSHHVTECIEIPKTAEKTSTKPLSSDAISRKSLRISLSNPPSTSRDEKDLDASMEGSSVEDVTIVTENTPEATQQVTEPGKETDKPIDIPKNEKLSAKFLPSSSTSRKSLRIRISKSPSISRDEKLDVSMEASTSKDTENTKDSTHHVTECIEIPKTAEKTSTKPLSSDTISRKSLRISLSNPPSTTRDEKDLDVSMEGSSIEDVTVVTENTSEATQQDTEPGKETDKSIDIPENEKLSTKSLSSGTSSRKSLRIRLSQSPSISRDEKLDVSMGASTSEVAENTSEIPKNVIQPSLHVTEPNKDKAECIKLPGNDEKLSTKPSSSGTSTRKSLRNRLSISPSSPRGEKAITVSTDAFTVNDIEYSHIPTLDVEKHTEMPKIEKIPTKSASKLSLKTRLPKPSDASEVKAIESTPTASKSNVKMPQNIDEHVVDSIIQDEDPVKPNTDTQKERRINLEQYQKRIHEETNRITEKAVDITQSMEISIDAQNLSEVANIGQHSVDTEIRTNVAQNRLLGSKEEHKNIDTKIQVQDTKVAEEPKNEVKNTHAVDNHDKIIQDSESVPIEDKEYGHLDFVFSVLDQKVLETQFNVTNKIEKLATERNKDVQNIDCKTLSTETDVKLVECTNNDAKGDEKTPGDFKIDTTNISNANVISDTLTSINSSTSDKVESKNKNTNIDNSSKCKYQNLVDSCNELSVHIQRLPLHSLPSKVINVKNLDKEILIGNVRRNSENKTVRDIKTSTESNKKDHDSPETTRKTEIVDQAVEMAKNKSIDENMSVEEELMTKLVEESLEKAKGSTEEAELTTLMASIASPVKKVSFNLFEDVNIGPTKSDTGNVPKLPIDTRKELFPNKNVIVKPIPDKVVFQLDSSKSQPIDCLIQPPKINGYVDLYEDDYDDDEEEFESPAYSPIFKEPIEPVVKIEEKSDGNKELEKEQIKNVDESVTKLVLADSSVKKVISNKTDCRKETHVSTDQVDSSINDNNKKNDDLMDSISRLPEPIKMNGYHLDEQGVEFSDNDFNVETSSINSEDSEPLAITKKKIIFKNRKNAKLALEDPEFVKYMELRQDDLMDQHPELNKDEIVEYLYKTWQYEENSKSDIIKNDDIEQSSLVKGLNDNLRQKSMRNRYRDNKKRNKIPDDELLSMSLSLRKKRSKKQDEDTISLNSDVSDTSIKRRLRTRICHSPAISLDENEFSVSKDCSPERKPDVEDLTIDSDDVIKVTRRKVRNRILDDSTDEESVCLLTVKQELEGQNDDEGTVKIKTEEPETRKSSKKEHKSPKRNKNMKIKKYFSVVNTETKDKTVNGHNEIEVGKDIKEEYDPDVVSISSLNSEDSEVSLSKRKQRKTADKNSEKSMDDPEFLKYVELRQDVLIDENPQLTQDEIVAYLYKTWLYEESVKSDLKKTDDIEQANLVKGLNSEVQTKKLSRKKIKVEKEQATEELSKDKLKRKVSLVQPFYNEDTISDIEDEIELFEIFRTKKKTTDKKPEESKDDVSKSEKEIKSEKIDEFIETGVVETATTEVYDEVELYFAQLPKPKPNVFKGLVREKVCEICEKTGNLVKCKSCCGMFHISCHKKEPEVEGVIPAVRGRKKKKKKPGRKPKNFEDSESHSDEKSQDVSLELNGSMEEIEFKPHIVDEAVLEAALSAKMKEILPTIDLTYDSYSSDEGLDWNSLRPGQCEIVDVKLKPKIVENYSDYKCHNCQTYSTPVCFVCKEAVSKTGVDHRQKCQTNHCNKYYHLECLDHWPQTQFNSGEPSKNHKKNSEHFEPFMCPRHVCHTCVSDDPRGCKTRFCGDKLARCVRCPATYHTFTKCLPAGTQILTGSLIVCPRHYEHRPGKIPCHVNTGWCFICALGGSLICCEYCPTSFHAECLNIDPPEGGYMCEDCETGRLPLYGEMVWVKLGHYRWWPGIVLHPSEIPENILSVKHSQGEFVVRFFGQYDHYWVNRGRVFPFQEGDSGRISTQKSKIDAAFITAMEHAHRAFEILKNADTNDEESQDIASSLLPPHYVKLKANKPCGSLIGRRTDIEESSLAQCECDPMVADPCGPYSHCLNRMLLTECGPICRAGDRCSNRAFEKRLYPKMVPYRTPHRGWGLKTLEDIKAGQFVIEYVGELIDEEEFRRRMNRMHEIRDENFYFLTLDKERMIDAGPKGNLARFMNHCCEPNCETQKWTVLGDVRVGLFAINDIPANSELTFNYNLECAGIEKKRCLCGARRCSGYIGAKPKQVSIQ
ncbi:uncharacterized protein LOC135083730 [Ostrinia nubilalis]|uniref:uncharacterized protein LOC135083730 n=1 Tax=Ostrinia nubilalis TaxID=29057 RepID=UPI0030825968